jgi:hypothetical protein
MRSPIGATVALLALLSTGACAALEHAPGAAANATNTACPPLRTYSKDFRDRAIAELELLPANSAVEEMLTDYAVLRQQIHACQP